MPRGGARPGAGRPRKAINKRTRRRILEANVNGLLLPLDYCLQIMRDETAPQARRDEMARAALPFLHARLAPSKPAGDLDSLPPIDPDKLSEAQLESLLGRILAAIGSRSAGLASGGRSN